MPSTSRLGLSSSRAAARPDDAFKVSASTTVNRAWARLAALRAPASRFVMAWNWRGPARKGKPTTALVDQMLGGELAAQLIVDDHAAELLVGDRGVDQDDGAPMAVHGVGVVERPVEGRQDQSGGAGFVEVPEVVGLPGLVDVAVGEQELEPGPRCGGFDAPGDVDEERVLQVDQDQADRIGAAHGETAGGAVADEPQRSNGSLDLASGRSATRLGRFNTFETVPMATPAWSATSCMLGAEPPVRGSRACDMTTA